MQLPSLCLWWLSKALGEIKQEERRIESPANANINTHSPFKVKVYSIQYTALPFMALASYAIIVWQASGLGKSLCVAFASER